MIDFFIEILKFLVNSFAFELENSLFTIPKLKNMNEDLLVKC